MSTTLHAPPSPNPRPSMARRRGRLTRPAVSLIAQGEPMVWLTGGAMILCIAMIVGLLLLVLASGLPTFWPAPLVRAERVDGKIVMGEVTREERFEISADTVQNLDGVEADAASRLLASGPQRATRRLIRTGNFELTNEHFQWLSDFAIKPGGESRPEWGVTVERMEWGRFYGEPHEFIRRHVRTLTAEEQELAEIQQYLESQRWRLTPEQAAPFDEAVVPVMAALQEARLRGVAGFVDDFPQAPDVPTALVLADGQEIASTGVEPQQDVREAVERFSGSEPAWEQFQRHHDSARARSEQKQTLEEHAIGEINRRMESARLAVRKQELTYDVSAVQLATDLKAIETTIAAIEATQEQSESAIAKLKARFPQQANLHHFAEQFLTAQRGEIAEQLKDPEQERARLKALQGKLPAAVQEEIDRFLAVQREAAQETAAIQKQIDLLAAENSRYELVMATADGQTKPLQLADIVRAYPANQLALADKLGVYFSRWSEFLTDNPREANSEGGVFPAIWGTVVMTLVMSLLVVPFGVLAALYLREYARAGFIVSAIRISISNLAGVPSIVFGVFGLGFFCYVFGSFVDGGPKNAGLTPLPPASWYGTMAALAVCGVGAFATGLSQLSGRKHEANRWRKWLGYASIALWLSCATLAAILIFFSPFFHGFFAATLPNPTFGKGGLLWASLTLALLTLPVVIVATEEALSAVPNSLREGSYACGASKWQTIRRIVLPHAMPGIMTGMILAMARGAGEAAPLMLVGAVKLAPDLPIDGAFPFIHFERSFMHLGFHIFDVGFQSQNSEAAKPMVFTTTLLLILIIATLNLSAIWIRSRLRKKYLGGQF